MKNRRTKRKLTDKQALIIVISVLCAIALLIGALVIIDLLSDDDLSDPHAGHNHDSSSLGDGHYEGDGHDHGTSSTTGTNSTDKVKYQLYTNTDGSFRAVFRDANGKTLKEENNIPNQPLKETVNADKGVYALSWATGNGPNDFKSVYYNMLTGQISDTFHAARGCDGVRVAYGSEDQTKVIVQDLFDKNVYYKEHALQDPYTKGEDVIMSGKLQADKKTVVIAYTAGDKGATQHTTINLYD